MCIRAVPQIILGGVLFLSLGWGMFALKFVLWVLNKNVLGMRDGAGNPQGTLKLQVCSMGGGISDKLCPGVGAGAKWSVQKGGGGLKRLPPRRIISGTALKCSSTTNFTCSLRVTWHTRPPHIVAKLLHHLSGLSIHSMICILHVYFLLPPHCLWPSSHPLSFRCKHR